jgi:hypothetical protein
MADRYQDRPFPADDDRASRRAGQEENDPLAELARLIGQTDPSSDFGRPGKPMSAPEPAQWRGSEAASEAEETAPVGPPRWMQRAAREEPPQDFAHPVHPLRRYASQAAPEPQYEQAQPEREPDPARYDDALYGEPDPAAYDPRHQGEAYADDPYAYQDGDADEAEEEPKRRRGGMITVAAVLALAVIGTGGAFAYRTWMGSPRSGEPPIIKADTTPTKIVPAAPGDSVAKLPDRMTTGGAEKIVPREEAPVDVSANPRTMFPPLSQNATPPTAASVAPAARPAPGPAANGTLSSDEPRKIKVVPIKGDPADVAATPAAKPAAAARPLPTASPTARVSAPAANANASANAPLSLSPQATQPAPAEPRTQVASTNPTQSSSAGGGSYVVQVSSQRSEADAQASYRALQGKFPSVLGSRQPLIKRADLGDKGVYYRAMVGPFASSDEAAQICGHLKTAGGQCVVQKN